MAPCERQQLEPIFTVVRLSIQTFSPIQVWSSISRNHGYLMFTDGLTRTPLPTLAPNRRNKSTFNPLEGFQAFLKKRMLVKYQSVLFRPFPGLNQELSYLERSVDW